MPLRRGESGRSECMSTGFPATCWNQAIASQPESSAVGAEQGRPALQRWVTWEEDPESRREDTVHADIGELTSRCRRISSTHATLVTMPLFEQFTAAVNT